LQRDNGVKPDNVEVNDIPVSKQTKTVNQDKKEALSSFLSTASF
jgi:hypothetical protein